MRLIALAVLGVLVPHLYWLSVVTGVWPTTYLPAYNIGLVLLAAGAIPAGLLVRASARRLLGCLGSSLLATLVAFVVAFVNYQAIAWWYGMYFYNA
ncbi:MAG: hypothetical protein GY719_25180 [bacterium]|nr:hypothetical protein [bacterium]